MERPSELVVLLLVSICGVVATKLTCSVWAGQYPHRAGWAAPHSLTLIRNRRGRALATGWRHRSAAEAWLAARSDFGR